MVVNINDEDLCQRLRVFRPSYFDKGLPKPSKTKEYSKADKMRPLFHEVTEASLEVPFQKK